jgi:hypothetical protein
VKYEQMTADEKSTMAVDDPIRVRELENGLNQISPLTREVAKQFKRYDDQFKSARSAVTKMGATSLVSVRSMEIAPFQTHGSRTAEGVENLIDLVEKLMNYEKEALEREAQRDMREGKAGRQNARMLQWTRIATIAATLSLAISTVALIL